MTISWSFLISASENELQNYVFQFSNCFVDMYVRFWNFPWCVLHSYNIFTKQKLASCRPRENDECHLHYQYCKKAWMFYILASWRHHWGSLESIFCHSPLPLLSVIQCFLKLLKHSVLAEWIFNLMHFFTVKGISYS